jgi:hypothetical protein
VDSPLRDGNGTRPRLDEPGFVVLGSRRRPLLDDCPARTPRGDGPFEVSGGDEADGTKEHTVFIYCDTIDQLTEITAGLVKQGLTFSASMQQHSAGWKITLTGGY